MNAVLSCAAAAERLVETSQHDDLDADEHNEELDAYGARGLATHQDEAAADKYSRERGEDRAGAVAERWIRGDVREVQRHRDEHKAGQGGCTAADHHEVVAPEWGVKHRWALGVRVALTSGDAVGRSGLAE